jgi:hypothetical protein
MVCLAEPEGLGESKNGRAIPNGSELTIIRVAQDSIFRKVSSHL